MYRKLLGSLLVAIALLLSFTSAAGAEAASASSSTSKAAAFACWNGPNHPSHPTIRYGSQGWDVIEAQCRLRDFAGLEQFATVFADPLFWACLWRTLIWTAGVVLGTVLIAVPVALVVAGGVGFANGVITVRFGLPSFITTLGMFYLLYGILLTTSRAYPVPVPEPVKQRPREASPRPVEKAPPPSKEPPAAAEETIADLTGTTLTGESAGGWVSAVGSGTAMNGPIGKVNADPRVTGVLVLRPLPAHLDEAVINATVDPRKDIEGQHPENAGLLALARRARMRDLTAGGHWGATYFSAADQARTFAMAAILASSSRPM